MKRRDLFISFAGFIMGGGLATTAGLSYYYYRRSKRIFAPREISESGLSDWILTSEDIDAIEQLNAVPIDQRMELLDQVDIPGGGDFAESRVSGVDECVSACLSDDKCSWFTYARTSHPVSEKRNMCWLKSDGNPENQVSDIFYVSGRRLPP